jgi:hypothetical protein
MVYTHTGHRASLLRHRIVQEGRGQDGAAQDPGTHAAENEDEESKVG